MSSSTANVNLHVDKPEVMMTMHPVVGCTCTVVKIDVRWNGVFRSWYNSDH